MDDRPIDVPEHPCLRCDEHEGQCELLHGLLGRLMVLESRVSYLEERGGVRHA